jgi:hypothetical protein
MKQGIEGILLSIAKAIFDKPIANIRLNGEKLKSAMRQEFHSYSTAMEFLARELGRKKK